MTDNPFALLRAPRPPVTWERPERAPKEAATDRVWIGADPNGLGFEVAVAEWKGAGAPTQEALRTLHSGRLRNRAIPLCVAVYDARSRAWIFGPAATAPPFGPIRHGQAVRILQAALDERTGISARSRVLQARDAFETAEIPGFDPQGLFAIRELTYGVPRRPGWAPACERSRSLLATSPRGNDLIRGLGFDSRSIPGNALLLTVGQEPPRAIAILLRDDESFDSESARFAKSPIYHGLEIARQNNVRWLVVARGPQLRLYPTSPDVGVGRRGATQTYFGLDLALLDDEHAGYLDVAFSAAALAPGGSVDDLLQASRDYAVSLGERLRERIYEKVVDPLSTAIARSLGTDGVLDEQRLALAYRLTLRILFRLLFQAYAEDTRLLPLHRNERYTKASLKELARDLAEHPDRANDSRSTSLWDGLGQVWRVIDNGDAAWGVPAYNGGLFGSDVELHPEGAEIARLTLHNDALGPALAGLLVDVTADEIRGPVDFRSLDVRDFGTIYEGLLESGLSLAATDLTDEGGTWRAAKPGDRVDAAKGAPYFHTKSGDRKATGSYFTKPFAVEHLLERALDPALDAHLEKVAALVGKGDQVGAARLFFDFRVADLAMGSGHFLVAAIGHIEAKYGAFLERNPIPGVERELLELRDAAITALTQVGVGESEIDRSALLGRQIARRCVYGLDINDLAVELTRLAIWVRTFVPGLPMSSLDHQLVCGNSLTGIGTIEEAIAALDPDAQSGAMTFSGAAIEAALSRARVVLEDAAALKESTSEEARAAQAASQRALESAEPARILFDAAIAVRLGVLEPPAAFDAEGVARAAAQADVQRAMEDLDATHFPVRFPEVFLRDPSGFDVLIGNPPWEEVMVDETTFWSTRMPAFRGRPPAEQRRMIEAFRSERPDLVRTFEAETVAMDRLRAALSAGPYPGMNEGNADLYKAFSWRAWALVRRGGRIGVVLPRAALSGSGSESWRGAIYDGGEFDEVTFLLNTGQWVFADVHGQYTVALVTVAKRSGSSPVVRLRGPFGSLAALSEGMQLPALEFPAAEFRTWATGGSFPLIPSVKAGEVFAQMRRHPRFDSTDRSWRARAVQGDFNATTDRAEFTAIGAQSARPRWPVLSGAAFNLWTPDTGEVFAWGDSTHVQSVLQQKRVNQHRRASSAFSEFPARWAQDPTTLPCRHPRIVFRDVTNRTNTRTVIAALVPGDVILTNAAPYLLWPRGTEHDQAFLLGVLCSIPLDWYARCVVELHVNFHLLNGFPIPEPGRDDPERARVEQLAGRLAAVDDRFGEWAAALGIAVGSVTDADRPELIAELDAVVSHLYGLQRDQVEHVFETFHRGWDSSDRLGRVLAYYDRLEAVA